MPLFYTLVNQPDDRSLTVLHDGRARVVRGDNPRFDEIVERVKADDESVFELLDAAEAAARRFEALSERVAVNAGSITFDGDPVDNALTRQVKLFLEQDVDDWKPLVNFFEKVMTNPEPHSREQLFDWVGNHDLTITDDGDIVAYKGVYEREGDENYRYQSGSRGQAVVDGVSYEGYIPYDEGAVVIMPRTAVVHDPNTACSTGLHVGTYSYALAYAHGAMMAVVVDPRDVVSVPRDAAGEKIRVCRLRIAEIIECEHESALLSADEAYEGDSLGSDDSSAQEAAQSAVDTSKMVTPSPPRFNALVAEAKSKKKGLPKLAARDGWVQVGDDPKDRKSWRAPKKR